MGASHVAEFPGDPKLEPTSGAKLVPVVVETALPSADGDFEVPDSPPQDGQTRGAAVVVPARQQPALPRPVTPAVEAQASILIVDDNAINLKVSNGLTDKGDFLPQNQDQTQADCPARPRSSPPT